MACLVEAEGVYKVEDIDLTTYRPRRGGVIPYFHDPVHGRVFCLGADMPSGNWTDFGGSIIYPKDGNCIRGALREFWEETLHVFGRYRMEEVMSCWVLCRMDMCILFLQIPRCPQCYDYSFNINLENARRPEVSSLVWVSGERLADALLEEGIIYEKVRHFLRPYSAFIQSL